jgi:hypothetical protein
LIGVNALIFRSFLTGFCACVALAKTALTVMATRALVTNRFIVNSFAARGSALRLLWDLLAVPLPDRSF